MFRPKGSMCISCKKALTCNAKELDFYKIGILEKNDGDGWIVVKCTAYEHKNKNKSENNYKV